MKLVLVVENTINLESGSSATAAFTSSGGIIGSSIHSDWMLKDRRCSVDDEHLEISFSDGSFCAQALSEKGVTLNAASRPTMPNIEFRISDGDRWQIGDFLITAFISVDEDEKESSGNSSSWNSKFASLDTIIPGNLTHQQENSVMDANSLLSDSYDGEKQKDIFVVLDDEQHQQKADPVLAIEEMSKWDEKRIVDPVELLTAAGPTNPDMILLNRDLETKPNQPKPRDTIDDPLPHLAEFTPAKATFVSDDEAPQRERNSMNANSDQSELDSYLNDLSNEVQNKHSQSLKSSSTISQEVSGLNENMLSFNNDEQTVDHVVLRPLLKAMGLPVKDMNPVEANEVARLAGETIRTLVVGLMQLETTMKTLNNGRSDTQLHPLEDNPLKIETDPVEAMKSLFLSQNPVHLHATAAVSESISEISLHEKASREAINIALRETLKSLSPEILEKRFSRYKGGSNKTENSDAWHWQMYGHYFSELNTERQRGLEPLFWDIYQLAYERAARNAVTN